MINSMHRTREEIREFIRMRHSSVMANRVTAVGNQFKTIEDFLNSTNGELIAAYRSAFPELKRDLGERFYNAVADARRFCTEEPVRPSASPQPTAAKLSLAELKAMALIMEQLNIATIDADKAHAFFESCKED